MIKSIIGYTGLVGKNLCEQYNFNNFYNSSNIEEMQKLEHDIVFCAAPRAEKWIVNKDPINDLKNITNIINILSKTKIKKLVLYSTIDVYGANPKTGEEAILDFSLMSYYGKNRFFFEKYISNFIDTTVIRLPGLFGNHLKKNIIFDLKNKNMLENINLQSKFQWFYLKRLALMTEMALNNNYKVVNCVTEPIKTETIVKSFFPNLEQQCSGSIIVEYDIKSNKTNSGYFLTSNQVLNDLNHYLNNVIDN
jgi:nucleoside-diphosphate-sugar epimerase